MITIINCGSNKTPQIASCVSSAGYENQVITIEKSHLLPANTTGIVVSGAPILLTEVDPQGYLEKLAFLKNTTVPALGICFGHQIIGLLHGATIKRGKEDRVNREIEILEESILLKGLSDKFYLREDHCEEINLPINFTHIAKSSHTKVEIMQHITQPLYGIQAHPEVSSEIGQRIINNFCSLCN